MTILRSEGAGEVSAGLYDFPIDTSLRFQPAGSTDASIAADNPYLTTTLSGSGGTIWTFSCWVKLADLGTRRYLIQGFLNTSANYTYVYIHSSDQIIVDSSRAGRKLLITTIPVLRDPNSWYNIVVKFNGTSGSTELKVYVNGVEQGYTTTVSFTAHQSFIAAPCAHYIGNAYNYTRDFAGYMAEVNLIDGTALDADSFGETKDGIWIPKDTSGLTFGDNGFRLEFKQTGTGGDANGIGADTSGSTNHFAVGDTDGLGASDVVLDSPTNNFPTLNPLDSNITLSEGNLKAVGVSGSAFNTKGSFNFDVSLSDGWYFEFLSINGSGDNGSVGLAESVGYLFSNSGSPALLNNAKTYNPDGSINFSTSFAGDTWGNGDIIGVAVKNGKVYYSKNGVFQASADPANETNPAHTGLTGFYAPFMYTPSSSVGGVYNFGQDSSFAGAKTSGSAGASDANGVGDFYYAPPSGFLAPASSNLPEPDIIDSTEHFNQVLWTGDNSVPRNITGVGFSPDWIWVKDRIASNNHVLVDTVRGISELLYSNTTTAGVTSATQVSAVGADGFTIGSNTYMNANGSSNKYVAWNWLAGGTPTATNSAGAGNAPTSGSVMVDGVASTSALAGAIPATKLSANTTAGFSIVSYTGIGGADKTIAHGLSSPPELTIIKDRDSNSNNNQWQISSSAVGDDYAYFTTAAFTGVAGAFPTSGDATTLTIGRTGNNALNTNESGDDFIMYNFHSVEGYSKVASYEANNNADGPMVFTGFRPAWVMIKAADTTSNWFILDNTRDTDNPVGQFLYANLVNVEAASASLDFLSNGFKVRNSGSGGLNYSGTYIYLAFADQPFKFANAR